MKAISFWDICKIAVLNYIDRMAINLHRKVATANAETFPPALGEESRRKRFAWAISAFGLRAEAKAAAKPLAGVGVNADD